MIWLFDKTKMPLGHKADENGIVAIGGKLSAKRLIEAYSLGIFPWPYPDLPVLWFCPDPRFVLSPKSLRVNQSLKKALKNSNFLIKADENFLGTVKNCQNIKRQGQKDTWITDEIISGYHELHKLGLAHSIEAYENEKLVGGLYGVSLGRVFFGESMFFKKPHASKICFITLVAHLINWDFSLIDCQSHTDNLERLGASFMPRENFLKELTLLLRYKSKAEKWKFYLTKEEVLAIISNCH
jgi:leucyl/phenylalanyl-tRNA--protein transferase